MINNNPENIPAKCELAICCNGNNEVSSTLSKLLLDRLMEESSRRLAVIEATERARKACDGPPPDWRFN